MLMRMVVEQENAGPALPRADIVVTAVIEGDRSYHGWPTVTRLTSGRLVIASSGGREGHVCRSVRTRAGCGPAR